MTKTFCDRCEKEKSILKDALTYQCTVLDGHNGGNSHLKKYELCWDCVAQLTHVIKDFINESNPM